MQSAGMDDDEIPFPVTLELRMPAWVKLDMLRGYLPDLV